MTRKLLSDTAVYASAQALGVFRGLIVLPAFANLVGAEGYGSFSQFLLVAAMLVPVASLRLETAAVRFLSSVDDREALARGFFSAAAVVLASGMILVLALLIARDWSARIVFGESSLQNLVAPTGLFLMSASLAAYLRGYFRVTHRVKFVAALLAAQVVTETAAIFVSVLGGAGAEGAIWALVGVDAAFVVVNLALVIRALGPPRFVREELGPMLSYSVPLVPNSLLRWLINYADRLVIVQVLGLASVGVYAASYAVASAVNLLILPLTFVLFPHLSRQYDRGHHEGVSRDLAMVMRYFLWAVLPICVLVGTASQPAIALVATDEFSTDMWLVLWVALGIAANGIALLSLQTFHLRHRTHVVTAIRAPSVALNLALNLVLVPIWDLHGAAIATLVSFAAMALASYLLGQRAIAYDVDWFAVLKAVVASVVMFAALWALPLDGVAFLFVAPVVGLAVYVVVMLALRAPSEQELAQVRRIVTRTRAAT